MGPVIDSVLLRRTSAQPERNFDRRKTNSNGRVASGLVGCDVVLGEIEESCMRVVLRPICSYRQVNKSRRQLEAYGRTHPEAGHHRMDQSSLTRPSHSCGIDLISANDHRKGGCVPSNHLDKGKPVAVGNEILPTLRDKEVVAALIEVFVRPRVVRASVGVSRQNLTRKRTRTTWPC